MTWTWQQEVARLGEIAIRQCEEHADTDIPICAVIHPFHREWRADLTRDVIQYFLEECKMKFPIGTKVRHVLVTDTSTAVIQYGIVRANETAYIVDKNPFNEAFVHGYKMLKPKQEKFETAEQYAAAVKEYDRQEVARQARILGLAECLFVSWHDKDGKQIAQGWVRPEMLCEFTEATA